VSAISDTAFTGGRILSMGSGAGAPPVGEPEVVVVRDGRIAATGGRALLDGHDGDIVDLAGRTLTPGFIDAHNHLTLAALHPLWADFRGVTDLDEAGRRLRDVAEREPGAAWVRGCQWDEVGGGLHLTRHDLDALGLDRPVVVGCFSYHRGVVSSAGLDALGISASTPDPPGGAIERDERGEPTGRLIELAWSEVFARSLEGYLDPDRWADLLEARAATLLTYGITAVHDPSVPPAAEAVGRRLAAEGRLPVSILAMPHAAELLTGLDAERLDEGPVTGEGDESFRVGPVKLFADGGILPAIDAHFGGQRIQVGYRFPGLGDAMARALERGYAVAVHAMGNAGLVDALDAWEEAARSREPGRPLRIEHVTLAGEAEVARLRSLGVTGVIQPNFVETLGRALGGIAEFDDARWLPFADLRDAGIALAASSDDPCSFSAPLVTSRYGVTRLTDAGQEVGTGQTLTMKEWLRLYTAGAAAAGGQEDERGRLVPGLRADMVVIEGDVDGDGPLEVAETWVGGVRVYDAAGTLTR